MARKPPALPLIFGNRSDVGRVRTVNEDFLGYFRIGERHLFLVADGMGGEAGGREASRIAVSAAQAVFEAQPGGPPPELLQAIIQEANRRCQELQAAHPELAGMGTTLDALLIEGDRAWYGHVGDSRTYLIRGGRPLQLARDHTMVQRMVDDGLISEAVAEDHPQRHVLSRVVGPSAQVEPEISQSPTLIKEGDCLVLCTDGLHDKVRPDEIAWVASQYGPQRACKRLVDLANERGGHDNITVQVVYRGAPLRAWQRKRSQCPIPESLSARGKEKPRRLRVLGAVGAGLLLVGGLLLLVRTIMPRSKPVAGNTEWGRPGAGSALPSYSTYLANWLDPSRGGLHVEFKPTSPAGCDWVAVTTVPDSIALKTGDSDEFLRFRRYSLTRADEHWNRSSAGELALIHYRQGSLVHTGVPAGRTPVRPGQLVVIRIRGGSCTVTAAGKETSMVVGGNPVGLVQSAPTGGNLDLPWFRIDAGKKTASGGGDSLYCTSTEEPNDSWEFWVDQARSFWRTCSSTPPPPPADRLKTSNEPAVR